MFCRGTTINIQYIYSKFKLLIIWKYHSMMYFYIEVLKLQHCIQINKFNRQLRILMISCTHKHTYLHTCAYIYIYIHIYIYINAFIYVNILYVYNKYMTCIKYITDNAHLAGVWLSVLLRRPRQIVWMTPHPGTAEVRHVCVPCYWILMRRAEQLVRWYVHDHVWCTMSCEPTCRWTH